MKLTHHGEGACVQMADHLAAMAAKDEQIRQLREALDALTEFERPETLRNEGARYRWDAADALLEATK